jgi:hypothetical protein
MTSKRIGLLGGILLSMAVSSVSAQAAEARRKPINAREHQQQVRIREGFRSGELTRREAGRLEAQQGRIRVAERFAKRDGAITPAERLRIQRELNQTSRQIYRQKNDNQDRR